jgi:hypothetical protein
MGMVLISETNDHDEYSVIFLAYPNTDWHLEFTYTGEELLQIFDEEDLLVFYPESEVEYHTILANISTNDIKTYEPKNDYWKEFGIMIKDPDGYGIIISNQKVK